MKRILLRASISPFEAVTPETVISKKIIGNNTGNLLFAFSMTRTILRDDTTVDFIADKYVIHNKITAEYINENYDMLVLPMANSFRDEFINSMNKWSELIEQLKIPCVVTGVGIQMPYEPDIYEKHNYDGASKRFVKAVLEHSSSIGVRGEITYSYLKHLGFNDIDVIGCPSIQMFGAGLPVRDRKPLTSDSSVLVTPSYANPLNFKEFIVKNRELLPDYYFVPQFVEDLRLMYCGIPFPDFPDSRILYPHTLSDEVLVQDKARFFIDVPSILEFNKGIDFNYGTRIHGAVGSILAGVPSLLFPTDARIRELAEYHNIPNIPAGKVNENTNIFELYDKTDFSQVNAGHEERFNHFIDYLDKNGVPHIYKDDTYKSPPFDDKIKEVKLTGPIHSFYTCSHEEQLKRFELGHKVVQKLDGRKIDKLNAKLEKRNETIVKRNETIEKRNETIRMQKKKLKRLAWYENSSVLRILASRIKHLFVK